MRNIDGARDVLTAGVTTQTTTGRSRQWLVKIAIAGALLCASQTQAQVIVTYSIIEFSVAVDRGELREQMRREHRARLERGLANRANHAPRQNFERPNPGQPDGDAQREQREQREAEYAERRERWQRMSPDERQQMRRDINQAGRNIYPQPPRRDGE